MARQIFMLQLDPPGVSAPMGSTPKSSFMAADYTIEEVPRGYRVQRKRDHLGRSVVVFDAAIVAVHYADDFPKEETKAPEKPVERYVEPEKKRASA
jgi:hypothetical protein